MSRRRIASTHHIGLSSVILTILLASLSAAAAEAAIPTGNLLANGNAELGIGSSDSSTTAPVPIPGWTTTTNFTEHTYDPVGSSNFPDVNAGAAVDGGKQFFAGGPENGNGNDIETATQDVNVSAAASEIDTGGVSATLFADLGGYVDQEDQGKVTAQFLGAASRRLATLTIGPVTAEDRKDTTGFLPRTGFVSVPRGTVMIRVVMTATKYAGAYNDAYLDNVSLTLTPAPPAPVLGKAVNVAPVSGLVFVKPRRAKSLADAFDPALAKGQGFVPLTAARQLPVGSQVDARAGTLQLTAATGSRHTTQIATLAGAVFSLSQTAKGSEKGLTVFALLEGDFPGAPSLRSCGAHAAPDGSSPGARAASVSPKVIQTLHASDRHGHFGTRGRHSSATVRGTVWDTIERCDGTLTVVKRGTVRVFDFRRKVTITVHAGKSYLAKAT